MLRTTPITHTEHLGSGKTFRTKQSDVTLAALVGHEGRWATLAGLVPICPWGTLVNLTPKYLTLVTTTPGWKKWFISYVCYFTLRCML